MGQFHEQKVGSKNTLKRNWGVGIAQWIAYLLPAQPARVRITAPEFFPDSDVAMLTDCVHCLDSGQCKKDNSWFHPVLVRAVLQKSANLLLVRLVNKKTLAIAVICYLFKCKQTLEGSFCNCRWMKKSFELERNGSQDVRSFFFHSFFFKRESRVFCFSSFWCYEISMVRLNVERLNFDWQHFDDTTSKIGTCEDLTSMTLLRRPHFDLY